MKNPILRVSKYIEGFGHVVQKTPINSLSQASSFVRALPITEFTAVIIDDTGFIAEVMPNGKIELFCQTKGKK